MWLPTTSFLSEKLLNVCLVSIPDNHLFLNRARNWSCYWTRSSLESRRDNITRLQYTTVHDCSTNQSGSLKKGWTGAQACRKVILKFITSIDLVPGIDNIKFPSYVCAWTEFQKVPEVPNFNIPYELESWLEARTQSSFDTGEWIYSKFLMQMMKFFKKQKKKIGGVNAMARQ